MRLCIRASRWLVIVTLLGCTGMLSAPDATVSVSDGDVPRVDADAPARDARAPTPSDAALDDAATGDADTGDAGRPGGLTCADRASHPEWLLCEDFEGGAGDFDAWRAGTPFHELSGDEDRGRMNIVSDGAHAGAHALHMPASAASGYRGASLSWLQCAGEYERGCSLGGHDELFLRAWVRFGEEHRFVHHFLSIRGRYTADSPYDDSLSGYWFNGTAGCLPDGTTHMSATLEVDRRSESPRHHTGYFYSYHPDMPRTRCGGGNARFPEICRDCNRWEAIRLAPSCDDTDHGCYWGETFEVGDAELAADPDRFTFSKGEWTCLEMRVRLNTPGVADGEMEYWIDDAPAFAVRDMRWRTVDTVALNRVELQHYINGSNWFGTPEQSNEVWFDDVVISTRRVGCR